ncbi:hypothetical protein A2U01_0107413, partial [Trifolium medium]|nr:hypothetical protein [Trifolium medium]
MYSPIAYAAAQ